MFQLTSGEKEQLVTNWHRFKSLKHSTTRPYAFTEYGVAMLSSVLNSERAIHVNIQIIRTFIQLREIASTSRELSRKLKELELKYDAQFRLVFQAIRDLMKLPEKSKKPIGFQVKEHGA
jgi:hypothetical protein